MADDARGFDRLRAFAADLLRSLRRANPRWVAAGLSVASGLLVFAIATELFPHHSVNHDEGVYLQQAELLLEGRLGMSPAVPDAVRPWFFLDDGGYLYPKYSPVPAGVFALGKLLGGYRVALAGVAAVNVALTYALGAGAFDRRTGLLAGGLLAVTPTFLLTSSVFLPYAPTTALNLLFALAYYRSARRGSLPYAALAGLAVGLAFFGRPYTAVLFAAPFVVHGLWTLSRPIRARDWVGLRSLVLRLGTTAAIGVAFVGVTLWYNARMTGSPLTFPFEAFAPHDGLGFGYHRIFQYEVVYTPGLAVRANAHLLWELATRWTVAAPLGAVLFVVGVGRFLLAGRRGDTESDAESEATEAESSDPDDADPESPEPERAEVGPEPPDTEAVDPGLPARHLGWLLVGVFASVVVGNVYFWGNYNVLATLSDPTDGFIAGFGPIYHFDVLVPLAVFGAVGALALWDRLRGLLAGIERRSLQKVALAAVLVVSLAGGGILQAGALDGPVEGHAAYTDRYEETYQPLESRSFDRALVFVPAAYGDWLNHPFQSLRNDPAGDGGLEGPVVYALDRSTASDFRVLEAYPDRRPYRFNYHGEWTSDPADRVEPKLRRLHLREGRTVTVELDVATPDNVRSGYVRLAVDGESATQILEAPAGNVSVRWRATPEGVGLVGIESGGQPLRVEERELLDLEGPQEASLAVTFATPDGSTLTYRQELDLRPHDGGVQAVWPPEHSVCRLVTDCGLEGTYLPDHPEVHLPGVWMNATATVAEGRNRSATSGGPR